MWPRGHGLLNAACDENYEFMSEFVNLIFICYKMDTIIISLLH